MGKGYKRLAQTIIISGLSVVIGYLINFFITPYITDNIGIDAYGFVSIANTTVTYATIITTALTAFVVRYISIAYHEERKKDANKYFSSSLMACVILSVSIFAVMALVTLKLELFLNIPDRLVHSVKVLFILVYINFIITTVTTPYGAAAYIKNRLDITGMAKVIGHLCDAGVLLILFSLFKPEVWFVTIGKITTAVVLLLISKIVTVKLTPELKFKKEDVSFSIIKEMMGNGIWNSLNTLGNTLNSGLDLIIANLMLSGVATGQISVAKTIESMFTMLYQVVFQPFQPRLLKAYASGNKEVLRKELQNSMKICGLFSNIAFAGFFSLGALYFKLWLPSQDYVLLNSLTLATVAGSITAGVIQPVYYVNTLTVKTKIPCFLTIASGLLNIGSMYLLLKYTNLGAYAVVLTTVVIMTAINLTFNPIYSAKCLNESPVIFYSVIIRHLISAAVMSGAFLAIERLLQPTTWMGLIGNVAVMVPFGVIIHVIIMYPKEKIKQLVTRKSK